MYQDLSLAFLEYEYEGEREKERKRRETYVPIAMVIFKLWYSLYMQYTH